MNPQGSSATADRLVRHLKVAGPQTTADLAAYLRVSVPAVRQHIRKLADDGLLRMTELRGSVGRPAQRWSLTARGHGRFPDAHAEMTVNLIASVRAAFGDAGLATVIADRYRASLVKYRSRMTDADTLADRVRRLCAIRAEEGYMAHVEAESQGYLLIESHCPICAAAEVCQGFCTNELQLFREVLGGDAVVERTEYLITGDRRCAYRIKPRVPVGGDTAAA